MGPDLDVHPDVLRRLSVLARTAAEALGAPAPEPPHALGPSGADDAARLVRTVQRAGDELAAFATVAEIVARRADGADRAAAATVRSAAVEHEAGVRSAHPGDRARERG